MAGAMAKRMERAGEGMHPSLQQTDFSFLFPSLSASPPPFHLCPKTCGEISSVRCSGTMAHNDDGGGGVSAGEKPTVAWSRASAGGRTKLGQAGEVVGRAHHIQLANVLSGYRG